MQSELFVEQEDYSDEELMLGLSGGINSAAVLIWLSLYPEKFKPKVLHLFYAHFVEHSPDTAHFVMELIRYARKHFKCVKVKITRNSVLDFFESQKMIPHPQVAPCTRLLKILPMHEYMAENGIKIDLVGYVREERARIENMAKKNDAVVSKNSVQLKDVLKRFPISGQTNEWCFQIVKRYLGWYPAIYDLRDHKGKRIFTHNNCLPCKNMQESDFKKVKKHYPTYHAKAMALSQRLNKFWGRVLKEAKSKTPLGQLLFHLDFGRTPEETGFQEQTCGVCKFD